MTREPDARERRDVVTPYAFQVDPALLGLPLAHPWQRAVAMMVDGLAIAILSQVPNSLLAIVIGAVVYRWTGQSEHPRAVRWRTRLRAFAIAVMLIGLIGLVAGARDEQVGRSGAEQAQLQLRDSASVARLAVDLATGKCRELDCAREPLLRFADLKGRDDLSTEAGAWEGAMALAEGLRLSDTDREQLHTDFRQRFEASRKASGSLAAPAPPDEATAEISFDLGGDARDALDAVRALFDALGIGLGWAALYFTVFSAWWNGQTPGKKLLGIRVVQLDGTPITLWEAFERCGGYAAGLATGLLGYIQVFWDPNRQAIQDKIAETVVIRGDRRASVAE